MKPHSLAIGLLLCVPLAGSVRADPAHSPVLPDPMMTPGDVLTTDATAVCQPGYAKSVRNVPQSVKNQVYRQYGAQCQLFFNISDNYFLTSSVGPPAAVTGSGER